RDDPENAGAEPDTGDQLAEYGRLADTFRELAEDLGEGEHRNEHHGEVLDLYTALRGRGRKEEWEAEKGDQPQAPPLHGAILGRDEIGFTLSGGNRAGGPVDRFRGSGVAAALPLGLGPVHDLLNQLLDRVDPSVQITLRIQAVGPPPRDPRRLPED